jgi:hypothetical protein
MKTLIAATLTLIAVVARSISGFEAEVQAPVAPQLLSETGLYAGAGTTQVDSRNRPFSPQYPLWSDGAAKKRWIRLPDGAAIDVANVSRWEFPVGTKFWKEFSFAGRKVETRLLWRVSRERWVFASYAWNETQADAVLAPESGIPNIVEVAAGKRHSIPSVADCQSCHVSTRTEILGFDALQLSDDRDPNALHGEALAPGMVTLKTLVDEGRMSPRRSDLIASPPRIPADSPRTRTALGYLSTNCGSCHNRESSIASLGLILKHTVADSAPASARKASYGEVSAERPDGLEGGCTPALATTAGKRGHWVVPEFQEQSRIINPGHPESSALIKRVKSRRPSSQMPPVGTVVADRAAVDLLTSWVQSNPDAWTAMVARCAGEGS